MNEYGSFQDTGQESNRWGILSSPTIKTVKGVSWGSGMSESRGNASCFSEAPSPGDEAQYRGEGRRYLSFPKQPLLRNVLESTKEMMRGEATVQSCGEI